MSHIYTVVGAAYDGSGTDLNPCVWAWGTVDGYRTAHMAVYWAAIQQANKRPTISCSDFICWRSRSIRGFGRTAVSFASI